MSLEQDLMGRANSECELCAGKDGLSAFEMAPAVDDISRAVLLCGICNSQANDPQSMDVNHWRCLTGSMWSEQEAVQIMSWRMLRALSGEGWAQDSLDQMYLSEEAQEFASLIEESGSSNTKDSNGALLNEGDAVTLIKDLVVKGANFTAKRGTLVKNISLTNNPLHIEGKVNGTQIVLVSAFLKKVNE